MPSTELPDPGPLVSLLNGFRGSQAVFAACELGIFDSIAACSSPGPTSSELHKALPCPARTCTSEHPEGCAPLQSDPDAPGQHISADGLQRLLNACVALGLLQLEGGRFTLSDAASTYLVKGTEFSQLGMITHLRKVVYPLFGGLSGSVCSGEPAWRRQFGYQGDNPFDMIYRDEDDRLQFMAGMHSSARLVAPALVNAFDLSAFLSAVDLGGATAAIAVALCQRYPATHACVVDLPRVVEAAQRHFLTPPHCTAPPEVLERIIWTALDFFNQADVLPTGDLYVLGRIIHDWDDARVTPLLSAVYAKLAQGGAVLLCECLLDGDEATGGISPAAALQSLNMLVQTKGRERFLSEYRSLLEGVGFVRVDGRKTGSHLDAIIAFKG